MTLNNVVITTEYAFSQEDGADVYACERIYYVKLEVPIPGGVATYKLTSTEEINKSLEVAVQLGVKVS